MKINNNGFINFQGVKPEVKSEKASAEPESKKAKASANNALGSYGKAFINMSFRGNIQNPEAITPEIKELTDEEFEEYKAKLDEKIKNLPDNVQEKARKWRLNKWNIFVADTILSNEELYNNENAMRYARDIIYYTNSKEGAEAKISVMDKLLSNDGELLEIESVKENAGNIIYNTDSKEKADTRISVMDKLLSNDGKLLEIESVKENAGDIIRYTDSKEKADAKIRVMDKLLSNDGELLEIESVKKSAGRIIDSVYSKEKADVANKILSDERLYNNENVMKKVGGIISSTDSKEKADAKISVMDKLLSNDGELLEIESVKEIAGYIIRYTDSKEEADAKISVMDKLLSDDGKLLEIESIKKIAGDIINSVYSKEKAEVANKILDNEELYNNENVMKQAGDIIDGTDSKEKADAKISVMDKLLSDDGKLLEIESVKKSAGDIIHNTYSKENADAKISVMDKLLSDERLYNNENVMKHAGDIIHYASSKESAEIVNKILSDERLYNNENVMKNAGYIIDGTYSKERVEIVNKILSDERLYNNENVMENAGDIIYNTDSKEKADARISVMDKLLSDERLYNNENVMEKVGNIISAVRSPEDKDKFFKIFNNDNELSVEQKIMLFFDKKNEISIRDLRKLNRIMGKDEASKLTKNETIIATKFVDTYKRDDVNEIPIKYKRKVLRNLVSSNEELFNISDTLRKCFPLLPKNQEEYCTLLPSLVRSIGVEEKVLSADKVSEFNKDLNSLSNSISRLNDEEFNSLEIKQTYSKDDFIKDVLDKVKDLSRNEKQKVYDYFGFEIHKNDNAPIGYSITGYPINLNNGKKLSQIEDDKTKEVIEQLRPLIVKFSENNSIQCPNKEIESELNKILNVLPELRTTIGKVQAGNIDKDGNYIGKGSHTFDVFKHSLKVMQKISQDDNFKKLDDSDKKLMLLASLLHDITKKEGYTDPTHANESAFDSFFISKKFNLSQEEQIKLNTLIKHHEWLGFINTSKDENELDKRLKDTAYDLRHDNILDMALIFTHADLKGVKDSDIFHSKKDGKGRIDFNGNIRSFGESADLYAGKMKELIEELKPTQPILPVTKIPSANTIKKAITKVNSDGSTNIKGVYQDKKGLVILKYNELLNEDLEKIGFPPNSKVKGIESITDNGDNVNTGNVKFFAHGLDYPNQLAKFDAFSLVDSDALLSVSYAERPESKYRFFRPQGILLDCDTKYIHGGGETDAGSTCKKNIQKFKNDYIFGGHREKDRRYVSDLIKNATGMDDNEYIKFVKENSNKPLSEIKPENLRKKIIDAFATINSNTRRGDRAYNEMYISNPKPPMAVFAYDMYEKESGLGNPVDFLNETSVNKRTNFLQTYALERNIPFVIFGE